MHKGVFRIKQKNKNKKMWRGWEENRLLQDNTIFRVLDFMLHMQNPKWVSI